MDEIVKQEIGRSVLFYFILFVIGARAWQAGKLDMPAYMVFVVTFIIIVLTIPQRVWFRKWLHAKRS